MQSVFHTKIIPSTGLVVLADHELVLDVADKILGNELDLAVHNIASAKDDSANLIHSHVFATFQTLVSRLAGRRVVLGKLIPTTKSSGRFYCLHQGDGTEVHFCRSGRCQPVDKLEQNPSLFHVSAKAGDRIVMVDAKVRLAIGPLRFKKLALSHGASIVVEKWIQDEWNRCALASDNMTAPIIVVFEVPKVFPQLVVKEKKSALFTPDDVARWAGELSTLDKVLSELSRLAKKSVAADDSEFIQRKGEVQKQILQREWWLAFANKDTKKMQQKAKVFASLTA